jgi:hydroxyacylglutathione hydrolase
VNEIDRKRPVAIICQSGYRSSIATSILEQQGMANVFNIVGGTAGWLNAGLAVE